jgi:hypothetical protein
MRKLVFAALSLSAAFVVPQSALAEAQWCRVGREAGGSQCMYYTFDQCAAATERLNGGGCVENPRWQPVATRSIKPKDQKVRRTDQRPDDNR